MLYICKSMLKFCSINEFIFSYMLFTYICIYEIGFLNEFMVLKYIFILQLFIVSKKFHFFYVIYESM